MKYHFIMMGLNFCRAIQYTSLAFTGVRGILARMEMVLFSAVDANPSGYVWVD